MVQDTRTVRVYGNASLYVLRGEEKEVIISKVLRKLHLSVGQNREVKITILILIYFILI